MYQVYQYPDQDTEIQDGQPGGGFLPHMDIISGPPPGFDTIAQSLIRWPLDFMFAYMRPVTIVSASFMFRYTFDQFGLPVKMQRCPVNWNETSSWQSLDGPLDGVGVTALGEKTSDTLVFSGDATREIVQAWADGEPNHGVLLSPDLPPGQSMPEFMRLTTRESWPQPTLFMRYTVSPPNDPES